jgi:threonine/homoserine/homoserine lactone efflux protein
VGLASTGGNFTSAGALVLGVFIGSSLWWLILSGSVGVFREKLDPQGMRWINRISGAIITGFGLFALSSL